MTTATKYDKAMIAILAGQKMACHDTDLLAELVALLPIVPHRIQDSLHEALRLHHEFNAATRVVNNG
jgi:hypothetical protein